MYKRSYRAYVVKSKPTWAFVPHPNLRGCYIRTNVCVVFARCPRCKAPTGVPCFTAANAGYRGGYVTEAHRSRSEAYAAMDLDEARSVAAYEVNLSEAPSRVAGSQ